MGLERIPFQSNRNSLWLSLSGRIFCGEPVPTSPENALILFGTRLEAEQFLKPATLRRVSTKRQVDPGGGGASWR